MPRRQGPQELRTALKEKDFDAAHEFLLRASGLTIAQSSLYQYAARRRAKGREIRTFIAGAGSTPDPTLRSLDVFDNRLKDNHLADVRRFPEYPDQEYAFFGPFLSLNMDDPGPYFFAEIPIINPKEQMVADTAYELRALARYDDKRLPRDVKKIVLNVGELAISD
jgi:hypothetical protein